MVLTHRFYAANSHVKDDFHVRFLFSPCFFAPLTVYKNVACAEVFIFHFFWRAVAADKRFSPVRQIISAACLFLASKIEEVPRALEDVVRVTYPVRHQGVLDPGTIDQRLADPVTHTALPPSLLVWHAN